jgi:hypothetical protein
MLWSVEPQGKAYKALGALSIDVVKSGHWPDSPAQLAQHRLASVVSSHLCRLLAGPQTRWRRFFSSP